MDIIETEKDKELEKILAQYPKKINEEALVETVLNWQDQTAFWLWCTTKLIELFDIDKEKQIVLQRLKDETLKDKALLHKFEQALTFEKETAQKKIEKDKEITAQIEAVGKLGFKPILEEDYKKLIATTNWKYPDYYKTSTAYMLFEGDICLTAEDAELLAGFPIIVTGNLTIENNVVELTNSEILLVFGDFHVKNLTLCDSTLYVQGTLFAESMFIDTGEYLSQINTINACFFYSRSENLFFKENKSDISVNILDYYEKDRFKKIQDNILEAYYTITKYDLLLDFSNINRDLKSGKNVFKNILNKRT